MEISSRFISFIYLHRLLMINNTLKAQILRNIRIYFIEKHEIDFFHPF